ncbi:MAG: RpiB/LacA/LacB family sugar-phosphate isomerase [Candidatus Saccharimonadales bacterium]|jgi:ribose 5-phosphate isomerase B
MKIYIGADHNGFAMKAELINYLKDMGYDVVDEGNKTIDPDDDFPRFAGKVVGRVLTSQDPEPRGILICGSGQGVCMAANRFKGIRASIVWDLYEARASRNDDDSNVLCLPARVLKSKQANALVRTWLLTPFAEAPRFKRRITEMDQLT